MECLRGLFTPAFFSLDELDSIWSISDVNVLMWFMRLHFGFTILSTDWVQSKLFGMRRNRNGWNMQQCIIFCLWSGPDEAKHRCEISLRRKVWFSVRKRSNVDSRLQLFCSFPFRVWKRKELGCVYCLWSVYFISTSQLSVQHEPSVFGETGVCHGSDAGRPTDGLH